MEEYKGPESQPMGESAEKFDAKGNERKRRIFEDTSVAWLSDEEYQNELEQRKEK